MALGLILAACSSTAPEEPMLVADDTVADDFRELAAEVFADFLDAFPAHRDCIGTVGLEARYELEDRAQYNRSTRTIAVRVPGSPDLLDAALIHELAHHLESNCDSIEDLQGPFLAALGNPDAAWATAATWEETPSEIYAEAAVVVVYGDPASRHPILGKIDDDLVAVVANWATS